MIDRFASRTDGCAIVHPDTEAEIVLARDDDRPDFHVIADTDRE